MFLFIVGIIALVAGVITAIVSKSKVTKRVAGIGGCVIAILAIGFSCVASIPTGHTGVVTTFGKVANFTLDSGINVKAPWQSIIRMDNRVQKQSAELSCFSADIQEVEMIYTINYQIRKADAMTIYSTIGVDYYNTVIVPCITESVKTVTAKYTAENLIADRTALADAIEKDLTDKLDSYNIILVSTSIEDMDFTDEFTNAVEAKQVAQQNKLKAETEADQKRVEAQANADAKVIAAQADADALLIQADAEAEANKKIAESLTAEILSKMYYDTWDGILPNVVGADSVVMMPQQATTATETK